MNDTETDRQPAPSPHYREPGFVTRHIMNPIVRGLTRVGISIWGSRILEVRGRTSGQVRRTPVNLLAHDGHQYLVAPRGHAQWVRNVRADGGRLTLVVGRRHTGWIATEVADADKAEVLRAYLRRWKMEVGVFFDGVTADSSDDDLIRIAPDHPVFILSEVPQP